jgi:aldose 1-epimerase
MRETRLRSAEIEAVILPGLGARLHSLKAFGSNVLRTPARPQHHREDPFYWGAYHMAPWCNRLRIADGARVGNRAVELEPNFPDGSALHGQLFAAPWAIDADGAFSIRSGSHNGWPWAYTVTLRVSVLGPQLRLDYALRNTSDDPMPAGIGLHPWFRSPARVTIPSTKGFPVNACTAAQPQPMTGALDLGSGAELPPNTDATWCELTSSTVEVAWPGERIGMAMRAEADDVVIVGARPAGLNTVAVEAQSHAPDGLRRLLRGEPHAMRLLAADETLRFTITLTFHQQFCGGAS